MIKGYGNNGDDGFEGVRRGNLIGTYLHGPLLPKNAGLADRLIELALARRTGRSPSWSRSTTRSRRRRTRALAPRPSAGRLSARTSRSRRRRAREATPRLDRLAGANG